MKLVDLLEFAIPLTVVSLRAWPSPTKGEQHSGIQNMKVDPDTQKVKIPNCRKLKRFLKPLKVKESVEKHDVHAALKNAGLEDVTKAGMMRYERKYKANIKPQDLDKILTANGYSMITHTVRGVPLEKYRVYEQDKFPSGKVELHTKHGKVYYVVFDYRISHD